MSASTGSSYSARETALTRRPLTKMRALLDRRSALKRTRCPAKAGGTATRRRNQAICTSLPSTRGNRPRGRTGRQVASAGGVSRKRRPFGVPSPNPNAPSQPPSRSTRGRRPARRSCEAERSRRIVRPAPRMVTCTSARVSPVGLAAKGTVFPNVGFAVRSRSPRATSFCQ